MSAVPLRQNRSFALMILGQIISLLGNSMLRFALSLSVLDQTGSAGIFGSVLAISVLPTLLLGPIGGVLADRLPRQRIMYTLDFLTAALIALFALLDRGTSTVPAAALLFALSAIQACYHPSVQSSVPLLVPAEDLPRANSIVSQVQALASILGPVAGGALYGIFSLNAICVAAAGCFFASAVMECFLRIPFTPRDGAGGLRAMAGDLLEAGRFFRIADFLPIMLVVTGLNFLLSPCYSVALPYYVKITLGLSAQLYSLTQAACGLGSILGAALTGALSRRLSSAHIWLFILVCSLSLALMVPAMAFPAQPLASWAGLLAAAFVGSLAASVSSVLLWTFLQLNTPPELLGKVGALTTMVGTCAIPLGQGACGSLLEILPPWLLPLLYFFACLPLVLLIRHRLRKTQKKTAGGA